MKLSIDTDKTTLVYEKGSEKKTLELYSDEAFSLLSHQWIKMGWNQKYSYTFSWLGRPIIQLPEDMIRVQEVIFHVQPDVIIETGVAHGGSLVYYASLCKIIGKGRVIGIDIDIRKHNRRAIESHPLSSWITLIEGNSVALEVVEQVRSLIEPDEITMVLLDSNHSKQHVLAELEAYHELVPVGSYIVVTDGIMQDLHDVPRGNPIWRDDNPSAATLEFVRLHPEFVPEQPLWPFNESNLCENVTCWPGAWLRRTGI